MKDRSYGDFLEDIHKAAINAQRFVADMDLASFSDDLKTVYAVARAVEIIGEATKRLPKEIRERYPGVPWQQMARIRDKVIHHYEAVDVELLWETATRSLPALVEQFGSIIDDLEREPEL